MAQPLKQKLQRRFLRCARFKKHPESLGQFPPYTQDPEAVGMIELQAWIRIRQFFPELPHSEILVADGDVVKKNESVSDDFRKPGFKVSFYLLICVAAVYVEKIDRAVIEGGDCVREVGA